jgi:Ca-activated chloride channel homolog
MGSMRTIAGGPLIALAVMAAVGVCAASAPRATGSRIVDTAFRSVQTPPHTESFRSKVELISVTATVMDDAGKLVTDLPREAFEVFEDGEPRKVSQFTHERVPVSLALLLDISDSMWGQRIIDAREAVAQFLFERLNPADEYCVLAFNHAPRVLTTWTTTPMDVRSRLDALKPSGGTAIYDALMAAMPLMETRTRPRAAVLIISDGADTASDATLREVRTALLRSDAFVYAIGIDPPAARPINTRVNVTALRDITDTSGGRTEIVRDTAHLGEATARIAEELNNQYLLGYDSTRAPDGEYHSIRVRVNGTTTYRVRARNGYIADPISRRLGLRPLPRDQ